MIRTVLVEGWRWKSAWSGFKRGREVRYWRQRPKTGLSSATKKTSKWNNKSLGEIWGNKFFCLIDFLYKERRKWNIHSFQGFLISYSRLKNNPIFVVSFRLWNPLKQPCLTAFLIIEIVLSWYYGNTYSYSFTLFNIPTHLSPLFHKSRTKLCWKWRLSLQWICLEYKSYPEEVKEKMLSCSSEN